MSKMHDIQEALKLVDKVSAQLPSHPIAAATYAPGVEAAFELLEAGYHLRMALRHLQEASDE